MIVATLYITGTAALLIGQSMMEGNMSFIDVIRSFNLERFPGMKPHIVEAFKKAEEHENPAAYISHRANGFYTETQRRLKKGEPLPPNVTPQEVADLVPEMKALSRQIHSMGKKPTWGEVLAKVDPVPATSYDRVQLKEWLPGIYWEEVERVGQDNQNGDPLVQRLACSIVITIIEQCLAFPDRIGEPLNIGGLSRALAAEKVSQMAHSSRIEPIQLVEAS